MLFTSVPPERGECESVYITLGAFLSRDAGLDFIKITIFFFCLFPAVKKNFQSILKDSLTYLFSQLHLEDQRKKKNKDKKGANNAIVFVQLETLASSKHYDFFLLFLSKAS